MISLNVLVLMKNLTMWVSSSRKNDKFRHIKNSTMISLNFLTFWLWMKNLIKLSQKEHLVIVCTYLGEKKSDKIRHVKNSWKRNNVHWFLRISKFFDVSGFVKNLSQKWYAIILDVYGENTRNDDFCGFLIFWLLWSFIEESATKMISKGSVNFEMSFWCLHFLPKNERKQVDK